MAGLTGGNAPPKLDTSDDYRQFMRSEAGSNLEPGSEEERLVLEGFKAARKTESEAGTQAAVGTEEQPGPLAEELKSAEEASGNFVRPEDSQAAHHPDEITVTKADGQNGEEVPVEHKPGPLEANNDPNTGIIDPSKLPPQQPEQPPAGQKPV